MRKKTVVIFVALLVSVALSGCGKQCRTCGKDHPMYKATFIPSGSYEYLCENCKERMLENSANRMVWRIEPIK